MAVTKLSDIINPQVMGDVINAKVEALCKITPYAHVDTTLQGVPGDTKTVPCWNYIGDAEDFDPEKASETDSEMDVAKLTASSTTFTIKCAGKSVGILQTAINSGLGDPIGQATSQLSKSMTNKIDNDVMDAAYTCQNVVSPGTVVKYAGIVDAVGKFEDEEDGVDKVMFIHPNQEGTLLKDPDFLSADKFQAGVAVNGSIGKIAGCWIKKSKKVAKMKYEKSDSGTITIVEDTESETTTNKHLATIQPECTDKLVVGDKVAKLDYFANPIIKLNPDSAETEYTEEELPALTIFLKKDIQVDNEWFPKKQRHDVTAAKYYGVALTNAAKVVIAKFKA